MATSSCAGALEFVDGGTIKDASMIGGDIIKTKITNSTFTTGNIETLQNIDGLSALVIAETIAKLKPAELQNLATAILRAAEVGDASAPASSEGDVARTHYGKSDAVLGEPDQWLAVAGGAIPLYK